VIRVLSHRGLWETPDQHNSESALLGSLRAGFGVETDVRDDDGALVISHDPPQGGELPLTALTDACAGARLPLAVNVKADGLSGPLGQLLTSSGVDWFAFDMSVPEMLRYARAGLPYFTRHSDVEPDPVGYESAAGVWLDAFHSDWFGPEDVRRHLDAGKRVALVSPELHGRPPTDVWNWLRELECSEDQDLMICTDHPRRVSQMLQEQP
jgi:hypothetical protein